MNARDDSTVQEIFERSANTFRSVLIGVRPDQHHLPTPCEPLDVAGLVSRAIGHQNWTRSAIEGVPSSRDYPSVEPAAWIESFDSSRDAMVSTLGESGVLERIVELANGLTFPGADVGLLAARNTFQFAWDLAVATSQDLDLDPRLAGELLEISRTRLVPQRGPNGFFGPEQVPPPGATTATVLAGYLGRDV